MTVAGPVFHFFVPYSKCKSSKLPRVRALQEKKVCLLLKRTDKSCREETKEYLRKGGGNLP